MNTDKRGTQTENIVLLGLLGILWVLLLTTAVAFVVNRFFSQDFFVGWLSLIFMCATPFQIVQAIVWHNSLPKRLDTLAQPIKGLYMMAMFFAVSLIVMPILWFTVGQGILSPILIHFVIQSVVVSLFVVIAFGCWPVTLFCKDPLLLGIASLVYCYVLNFVLFALFYNYHFFADLPFYQQAFDPGGLFNGISALTFAVTCAAILMLSTLFDLWPLTLLVKNNKQPLLGFLVTVNAVLLALVVHYLFVTVLAMDPMAFMVKGPVCIIFGTFLVQNMMQFQLFSALTQPIKGLVKTVLCFIGAFLMYQLYQWALPWLVGETLLNGPQHAYAQEIWIATAMLGITFPIINFVSGAFAFWPMKGKTKA
jgi:hypothetical protein